MYSWPSDEQHAYTCAQGMSPEIGMFQLHLYSNQYSLLLILFIIYLNIINDDTQFT